MSDYVMYRIRYSGSLGVRRIDFEREEMDRKFGATEATHQNIKEYVRRDLKNYFPSYYLADIFATDGEVIRMHADVIVLTVESK